MNITVMWERSALRAQEGTRPSRMGTDPCGRTLCAMRARSAICPLPTPPRAARPRRGALASRNRRESPTPPDAARSTWARYRKASRPDHRPVRRAEVLAAPIHDGAHALLHRAVLHVDAVDAREGLGALDATIEEVVVLAVALGAEGRLVHV